MCYEYNTWIIYLVKNMISNAVKDYVEEFIDIKNKFTQHRNRLLLF